MKTREIKIAGRGFALLYNYAAMLDMQERIANFDLYELSSYARDPATLPAVLFILARQGEKEVFGRPLDVEESWFSAHMRPSPTLLAKYQIAANLAIADGMSMETEDGDGSEEVDVILESLKKKQTESRP